MRGVCKFLSEVTFVVVIGAAFAFLANAVSPRGLALNRNYFPGENPPAATKTITVVEPRATNAAPASAADPVAARLKAKGLQLVTLEPMRQLLRDARYEQGLVLFVDARDDGHYQAGHIPGAYQFDHYHPEKYLAAVLPPCQTAQQIVVYCAGGECEDSEFAALTLRDLGVPGEKLFVYGGGMTEWTANQLPVELGTRKSGNIQNAGK